MKVLIVDDSPTIRLLLNKLVQSIGHEPHCYESAETAWEAYLEDYFPLIILDWQLTGMDGLSLCRQIRKHPEGSRSIILMFTQRNAPEDLQEVLKAGADDYLPKTADIELLKIRLIIAERQVNNLIEQKRVDGEIIATNLRLSSLIENVQAGVLFEGDFRKLLHVNHRLLSLIGKSDLSSSSQTITSGEIFDSFCYLVDDIESIILKLDEIARQRKIVKNEIVIFADGRTIEMDYVPVSLDGEFQGHLWMFWDVTERFNSEQELERAREQEVDIGVKIQQTLLIGEPPESTKDYDIGVMSIASQRIDGDFFDFYRYSSDVIDVIIGDVMGKGIPAALIGAATKTAMQRAIGVLMAKDTKCGLPEPEQIISWTNDELSAKLIEVGSFVTLLYCRFLLSNRVLNFIDCGHTKIIHVSGEDGKLQYHKGENMPLGFSSGEKYQQVNLSYQAGDIFCFYSDGVTETMNFKREQFGEERLAELIVQNRDKPPRGILNIIVKSIQSWVSGVEFTDDFTCLIIKTKA